MNKTQLAAHLKETRTNHGYSQDELAAAMVNAGYTKWSQATVWAVETGNRNLMYVEGIALSQILPGFGLNHDRVAHNLVRDARVLDKIRRLIEEESSFDLA